MLANSTLFSKVKTEFSIDGILELISCITAQMFMTVLLNSNDSALDVNLPVHIHL